MVHRLAKQVNGLISMRYESQLKGTCGQTKVFSLLSLYHVDFITDLVLIFVVIIRQSAFVTMSIFPYNFGAFV